MCGIVGFLDKTQNHEHSGLGRILLDMLRALACRGPDSAGVALFGPSTNGQLVVKVKLGNHGESGLRAQRLSGLLKSLGVGGQEFSMVAAYARFVVDSGTDLTNLIDSIESSDKEIEVVSVGRNLEIVKQVGSPANLEKTYGISQFRGTHGLGHTRLSTESRVRTEFSVYL